MSVVHTGIHVWQRGQGLSVESHDDEVSPYFASSAERLECRFVEIPIREG